MRPSKSFLATVRSAAKYLEPNTPTGLTGLTTHPSPRPALLYTYNQTLRKLKQIPSSSVYRQSTEALTKHRLAIVEATKPPGYDEWLQRVNKAIDANPEAYGKLRRSDGSFAHEELVPPEEDNWDGKITRKDAKNEGSQTQTQADQKAAAVKADVEKVDKEAAEGALPSVRDLEVEPALTADQINEIEQKIGAGLIEEIVSVAEGELDLAEEMLTARVWEELEEPTPPGQWKYFERGERV